MSMTPEGRVKHAVKKRLRARGKDVWYFMPVQNGYGVVGVPDFISCAKVKITPDMVGAEVGLFVAVETKAPGKTNEVTANQHRQITGIHAAAGIAVVVDDANFLPDVLTRQHQETK